MGVCNLCELPTGDTPVTAEDHPGEFCCRGCLEVSRTLGDRALEADAASADTAPVADTVDPPEDAAEAYLAVDGMHCTTCEQFLDLRGDGIDGVYAVDANYAMETARVYYDPESIEQSELPAALSGRGYQFRVREGDQGGSGRRQQRETLGRLLVGGFFAMLIMPWYFFYLYPSYVGVDTGILDVDATTSVGVYLPLAILGFLSTIVLLYPGKPILRGAWISIRTRRPNMDLLVAVAAVSA
jgi:Cu2+-exporting ATPase